METGIPTPDRLRKYAHTVGLFLEEMHSKYPSTLAFESEEERQDTMKWLELTQPVYQKDLTRIESQLEKDFKDVSDYWKRDHAYNTARRRVADYESPASWLPWLIGRITDLAVKYERPLFLFKTVRRFAETELRWKQGLSLAVANYLDGTSYRITTEAKASAIRIADLLSELETELQQPAAAHLLEMNRSTTVAPRTKKQLHQLKLFFQRAELQKSLNFRNDKHLLNRITAGDILEANDWAFKNPRKDLAFILLGLSAFDSPIELEPKTIERVWVKRKEQQKAVDCCDLDAHFEMKELSMDRSTTKKRRTSDPLIPNPTRSISGD